MIKKIQLPLQTVNLVVGFMVWVILSSLLPFIKEDISIPTEKVAMITAIPVVLGSVLRIPLGAYANLFGARIIFLVSFIVLLFPVYFISEATTYVHLIMGGIFLGIGGALFSVGVTSLPKYYPKEQHGFVNGIYGFGNMGTAVSTFAAPVIATQFGWSVTVKFYLGLLLVMALLNFIFGDRHEPKVKTSMMAQIKGVYNNEKMWLFSLFYFITFGAFVAFTVFLPNFLVTSFDLEKVSAGVLTATFIVLATCCRTFGGWLGDKFDCLKLLMGVFIGTVIGAVILAIAPNLITFIIGILIVALSCGIGNGVIFKLVPTYFTKQAGIVNGIVSMMGGLGGFFPPLLLAKVLSLTGSYALGFLLLAVSAFISLILVLKLTKQASTEINESLV
ncbi:nitrate/nitrite transporter [Bacillus massiliigorillae]|uniref:nitrate/nitrite transporter n=1 Tax=Bacillus massiliigorillae TaxID=1243664 RepID=UPI00039F8FD0|nr:nitrate/nitrite transporter [Bacillus massiliigorillae]